MGVEGRAGSDLPGPVRVAIVDDHPVVREAFGNLFDLVEGLEVVATAGDADEALAKLDTTPVDVAVVDFALPGIDGSVLTDRIKDRHPDVRVLIFTASLDPEQVRRAAESSAGHVAEVPVQFSAGSHSPADDRQTRVDGSKASAGHVVLVPSHVSSTSHVPAEGRQTVPAFPAGC